MRICMTISNTLCQMWLMDKKESMKKILVVSLYDGDNEIDEIDSEEFEEIKSTSTRCPKGDKVIWMSEEFLYIEV